NREQKQKTEGKFLSPLFFYGGKIMHIDRLRGQLVIVASVFMALCSTGAADEKPVSTGVSGSWTVTFGFGGGRRAQSGERNRSGDTATPARPRTTGRRPGMPQMLLNLREEGGKVTGDFVGFAGKATPIQDATFKDGELSFKVPQEMGPNKVTIM